MFMFYTDSSSRGVGNVFFSSFSLFLFEFFDCDQKSTRKSDLHLPLPKPHLETGQYKNSLCMEAAQ